MTDFEIMIQMLDKANQSYQLSQNAKIIYIKRSVWVFNEDGSLNHVGRQAT